MSSMSVSTVKRRTFRLCAVAAGLLASGVALADAQLDPQLLSKMGVAAPTDQRSEEHTSELQSLMRISYAVFCLKKKTNNRKETTINTRYKKDQCNTITK